MPPILLDIRFAIRILWKSRGASLAVILAMALGIGAMGAFALSQWIQTLLFQVSPRDVGTFAVVSLFLASVALLACWIPARRAARVDPMVALRHE